MRLAGEIAAVWGPVTFDPLTCISLAVNQQTQSERRGVTDADFECMLSTKKPIVTTKPPGA